MTSAWQLRRWAVTGLLAGALTGCGGAGGAGTAVAEGDAAATESPYLRFAEASSGSSGSLRVWDPARPGQLLLEVPTNGATTHPVRRRLVDAAAREWTEADAAQVVFVRDRRVYRIDLRGGQPHTPIQLSTLDTACSIDRVEPLDAQGLQAVVSVRAATAPDQCLQGELPRLLHTGMVATSAPVAASLVAVLAGDDAQASAVLASSGRLGQAGRLQLLTPALAPGSGLPGEREVASILWLGQDPARAGLGYLHDGRALRALHWTASGAELSAPLLMLAEPPQAWQANAQALWMANRRGQVVRAAAGRATLVDDLGLTQGSVSAVVATPSRLLASICVPDPDRLLPQCSVRAMPLAGGPWTTLLSDQPGVDAVALLGAVGERPLLRHDTGYYEDWRGSSGYADTGLRLLGADGSPGDWLARASSIPVWAARHPIGQPAALAGALDCSTRQCLNGQLRYQPLGGVVQDLGDWADAGAGALWLPRPLIEGLPGELRRSFAQGLQPTQRYTVTPGTAGSLVLVK